MLVILLTLNKSDFRQNLSSNITDFKQHSQATFGCLLLTVQHMYDLRMPCHAIGHQVLPTTLYWKCYGFERAFFTFRHFLPCTLSCWFWGFLGTDSATSKLAGLHADHWNIVPVQLLRWMAAIHKRGILVGSIYVPKASFEVRVPQPWNLPLTGFKPAFLNIPCVSSCLFWQVGHRVLWVLIDG